MKKPSKILRFITEPNKSVFQNQSQTTHRWENNFILGLTLNLVKYTSIFVVLYNLSMVIDSLLTGIRPDHSIM